MTFQSNVPFHPLPPSRPFEVQRNSSYLEEEKVERAQIVQLFGDLGDFTQTHTHPHK